MQLLLTEEDKESNCKKQTRSLTYTYPTPPVLQHDYAPIPPELNALDEQQAVLFAINVFHSFWVSHYSDEEETSRN
jgi:hypothetical protein